MQSSKYDIKAITLMSSKLSELYQFYVETLKFECINMNINQFKIQCGRNSLIFREWIEECTYHFAFNIPENQIIDSLKWIKKYCKVLEFNEKEIVDFPNWNAHSLYFLDPANNVVEFIARHNLDNSSGHAFDASSILEISEIGIPVENIGNALSEYKKELNFDLFWGDKEKFAAAGHETSLLITVPEERPWFPTAGIMSKIQPIQVNLSTAQDEKIIVNKGGRYHFL